MTISAELQWRVITPRVMPPKPEAKPLAPVRTLEQDAALSRAMAQKRSAGNE